MLTKDGLELSLATQLARKNLGDIDVTVSIDGFVDLCRLAIKGLDTPPQYVPTPPLTTPPTEGDEKRLRKMTKHEAIHELEGQCCVIARACCSLTNLDALTLAGFDIPETEGIMKLAEAVIERARVLHDAEFISLGGASNGNADS